MDVDKLSDAFSTSGQISTDDMPLIAALGYRSVACNRPDGEDIAQALFEAISQSAQNLGLVPLYFPIRKDGPTPKDIERFKEVSSGLPKPILAYCATGGRSRKLLGFEDAADR